jgi:putative flippase GtrA
MYKISERCSQLVSRLRLDRQNTRQFRRYFIVGLSNAALSYILLILLYEALPPYAGRGALSQAGASGAVLSWSYFWNRYWAFSSKNSIAWEGARFVVGQTLIFGLGVAGMGLMVDVLAWPLTASWIALNGMVIVVNFSLLKLWVFKENT